MELEQALFAELRQEVLQQLGRLQESAHKLAILDVLAGWAELALAANYVRPYLLEADIRESFVCKLLGIQ